MTDALELSWDMCSYVMEHSGANIIRLGKIQTI